MEKFSEQIEGYGHNGGSSCTEDQLGNRNDGSNHQDVLSDVRQSNDNHSTKRPNVKENIELATLELSNKAGSAAEAPRDTLSQVISKEMARESLRKNRFIKNYAANNRVVRLNTKLLEAIEEYRNEEVERLLNDGANPNTTCHVGHVSACHVAAYCNTRALRLLLNHKADKTRVDKFGRTPLHFAAWAGNNLSVAMLLDFPAEVGDQNDLNKEPEVEEQLKQLSYQSNPMIDVPCELPLVSDLPRRWKDSIEHKCRNYMTNPPEFPLGGTPLHVASCAAHGKTVRLLLAAGANPNSKDAMGLTPLDIAGVACFEEIYKIDVENYNETIETLIEFGGNLNTTNINFLTSGNALHTAVQLCSVEAIELLLEAGASIAHRNSQGNTPLHECVVKRFEEPLQVLAMHNSPGQTVSCVEVTNSIGYTVLQSAVLASWIPGVCVALEAGADVTFQADDGYTAIHIAACIGNLDILNEILNTVPINIDDLENTRVGTPIFLSILTGNLACVQTLLDAGASLKLTTYRGPKLVETRPLSDEELKELNMIVHATAEVGHVEILEFLLNYDKDLEKLLDYRCPYFKDTLPIEFAAHHENIDTYRFLLPRTVLSESFDPSRLLDILISKNRDDMLRDLLSIVPDAVRVSIKKGHCPLHNAIKHCDRNVILLLINNGADLSQRDESGITAIDLFSKYHLKSTEFIASIFDTYIYPCDYSSAENDNFEVVVDYGALIPAVDPLKEERDMRVINAILETENQNNEWKLLEHPLVESFIFFKAEAFRLRLWSCMLVFFHSLFVVSFIIYAGCVFDITKADNYSSDEKRVQTFFPALFFYANLGIVIIQELSCNIPVMSKNLKSWIYFFDFYMKLGGYGLAFSTPIAIIIATANEAWVRHLATLSLLVATLMFLRLLAKLPLMPTRNYTRMFWDLLLTVIKILAPLTVLVVSFATCFMIEFHCKYPFNEPMAALVKIMVMMTSEFDYGGTFTDEAAKNISTDINMLRFIFFIFLFLVAIVSMNLVAGIAVYEVQQLVENGNLRRLETMVELLNKIEISKGWKSFLNITRLYKFREMPQSLEINPVEDRSSPVYRHIIQILLNKAQEQMAKVNKKEVLSDSNEELLQIVKAVEQTVKAVENNFTSQINEMKLTLNQLQKCRHDVLDR